MEPMYISIQQVDTGKQIKNLMSKRGFTVKDIQHAMGFEQPQAVYKWLTGKSLPTIENLVILSRLLNTSIENILVIDGDVTIMWHKTGYIPVNRTYPALHPINLIA